MLKYRQFLTKLELFLKAGGQEDAPDSVALISFFLILSWFGATGAFFLQEYMVFVLVTGGGWVSLLFLLSVIITCSLLVRSRTSFLFAGTGMGTLGLLFVLPFIGRMAAENHEFIWHLAGEVGEQIVMAFGFFLAILFALPLLLLSLWFQDGTKRFWARRALLTTQAAFLTLSLLMMFKPGGLTTIPSVLLAFIIAVLLFLPVFLAVTLRYTEWPDNTVNRKIYRGAFIIQMIAAIGVIYYFAYSPWIWMRHLGEPVSVLEVRLGGEDLSRPLVEGESAYLISKDGRLLEVNLVTGEEKIIVHIPVPQPAEVGLPELTLPGGGRERMIEGIISRQARDKLSLRYVYSPRTAAGELAGEWTMDVSVNQRTGQVSWQLIDYVAVAPVNYRPPAPVEYAGITLYPFEFNPLDFNPFSMRVAGRGIATMIDPVGSVTWAYASQGWLLAGTDRGALYIIDTRVR